MHVKTVVNNADKALQCGGEAVKNKTDPNPMQNPDGNHLVLEQQRVEFVRQMELSTPREVLEAIDKINVDSAAAPVEWPEFVAQTYGACYAS
jgi:hypothetical protein